MWRRKPDHADQPAAAAAGAAPPRCPLVQRGCLAGLVVGAGWLAQPAVAAQTCSPQQIAEIRAAPTETVGSVLGDCNPTLSPDDVITRSLFFAAGSVSNGVVVDGAGATLDAPDSRRAPRRGCAFPAAS